MDRLKYKGELPESFFKIPQEIYKDENFKPSESPEAISKLFVLEQERNEIIIYTNHKNVRLVGIFPKGEELAYFGFWETLNNKDLHQEAFQMLEEDAFSRNRNSIIGPINFNTYHSYRIRLGEPPSWNIFDREPANPDYYPNLLQKSGFQIKATFESRMIRKQNIQDVYIDKEMLLNEISKIPFNFIPLTPANWNKYETEIFELIEAIFSENPFYKSITFEQFKLYYNEAFSKKLCPHSSVIFQDKKTGELVSISICHPNYAAILNEKPEFSQDFEKLEQKILLAKTVGVHPNFRKKSLMNFMGAYGMLSFTRFYEEVIFCLMRSDNHSLHFTDSLNYEVAKYALYQKNI